MPRNRRQSHGHHRARFPRQAFQVEKSKDAEGQDVLSIGLITAFSLNLLLLYVECLHNEFFSKNACEIFHDEALSPGFRATIRFFYEGRAAPSSSFLAR